MKRKLVIGVYGSAVDEEMAEEKSVQLGKAFGRFSDRVSIVNGACPGVPELVTSYASSLGVECVGFSPATSHEEQVSLFPQVNTSLYSRIYYIPENYKQIYFQEHIPELLEDLHFRQKIRNVLSTASCDAGIIISGRWGTLNEFTNLCDMGKSVGVLIGTGGVADEIPALRQKVLKQTTGKVIFSDNSEHLLQELIDILSHS